MVRALLAGTKTQTRRLRKPRWVPGNRLWVRETHWMLGRWVKNGLRKNGKQAWKFVADPSKTVRFDAGSFPPKERTEIGFHKRPSLFMPRWASRLTLEVLRTWQEPLQDISEADAIAEGITDPWPEECKKLASDHFACCPGYPHASAIPAYARLWESINGKTAPWASNPLVYATEFRVVANG